MRLFCSSLLAFVLAFVTLSAQVDPGECDTCYKNYEFESGLLLGGSNIPDIPLAAERYPLGLQQIYVASVADIASDLRGTIELEWDTIASHPWGGMWVVQNLTGSIPLVDSVSLIKSALRTRGYTKLLELGMKMSLNPSTISSIYESSLMNEAYYVLPEGMATRFLRDPVFGESVGFLEADRRTTLEALTGDFFWTKEVAATSTGDIVKLGGQPRFSGNAFKDKAEQLATGLYTAAGLPDSTRWVSIGVALRTDVEELNDPIKYPDTTVIATIEILVRNKVGDDCYCHYAEPWMSIEITKKWFLERANSFGKKYVAFDDRLGQVFYDIDTLIDASAIWNDARDFGGWGSTSKTICDSIMCDTIQCDTLVAPLIDECGDTTAYAGEILCDSVLCDTLSCVAVCDTMLTYRLGLADTEELYLKPGTKLKNSTDNADFDLEVYSRTVVPLSLLRTRIASPHYINLREGHYDSLVASDLTAIYADSLVDSIVGRIGPGDEPDTEKFRVYGMLSGKMQSIQDTLSATQGKPKKKIWANVQTDYDGFRLLSGDFDSTRYKIIQTPAMQNYRIRGGDPIPVFYANPDRLGDTAWYRQYRALERRDVIDTITGDTTLSPDRMVRLNSDDDYAYYNDWMQVNTIGTFRERASTDHGGAVKGVARVVEIFQFKYRDRFPNIPPSAVWQVIQVYGSLFSGAENNVPDFKVFYRNRTPTPEEIAVQCWTAMNSGANGLIFADMPFNGSWTGPQSAHIFPDLFDTLEYGVHRSFDQANRPETDPKWRVESSWLGFRSRNDVLEEVTSELRHIDTTIGWDKLLYAQEQMSVHDTLQSFDEIPMVRDLCTERAKRYVHHFDDSTETWTFTGSDTIDAREETYVELTHYTISDDPGSRAILVTSRRCWPIDTLEYDSLAEYRMDELVATDDHSLTGLGAIDVRRPLVVLENSTSIIGDSVVVEKITPNGTWTTTAAFGDTVELDWLLPGRGALYRLTPTAGGLSEHSTAYNNAVHSENPSTDSTTLDRLVVYERDSVVYLRSVDPNGVWSAELMLSDPDDTVLVNGKRTASNFFASLAIARDGTGSPRFVWERDSAGYRSVETAWINGIAPISRAMIDSTIAGEYDVERHRLIAPDSLEGPPALTPSIVAATDDSVTPGFLVSWANHDEGIDLMAVRHIPFSATSLISTDTAGLYGLYATEYALKVGQYPTLATAMMQERIPIPPTDFVSGPMPEPADTIGMDVERADLMLAHLAWQQGDGVDGADELIYYRRVGVDFSDDEAQPTLAAVDTTEHVSKNIPGCSFEHPSIAADSLQVGVAFEAFGNIGASRVVTLRHRDTSVVDPATQTPLKAWETTYYRFGEVFGASPFNVGYATGENVRPSLTHFPELDSNSLLVQPEGALVWFWQDNDEGRGHPQSMYRYGWFTRRALADGAHPSLTLVPLAATNPFEQSSVLHRGDSAERVVGTNDEGTSVWYYSGNLLNTPGNPLPALFNDPPSTGGIIAGISVFTKDPSLQAFCQPVHRGYEWGLGFDHPSTDHPDDDRHLPGDPGVITSSPGLPPTFFEPGLGGRTIVDTIDGAERISRTGLFAARDESVDVIRYAAARDSISLWLDTQPFDTQRGVAANIWSVVELVRASDSVVLWRGDTLTARGLDTTASPVNKILSIPVESWADSGEVVWIQVRGFATDGVDLSVAGGFTFFESFETQPSAKRGVGRDAMESGSSSTLDLAVVPNPVTSDRAALHVVNRGEGRITVTLWDNRGRLLRELPKIDGMRPGIYSVELDLEGLASGAYHLRAERGGEVTVESLTIP